MYRQICISTSIFSSLAQSCLTLCNPMDCSTLGLPVHHWLLESTQIHVYLIGDAVQPSHPLSFPSPPALNLSQHQVFSNESVLHVRWPNYWSFSFSIIPTNVYSGLISFRMDWLDLLAIQGTLKSLLQHHSSKASILQHSAFFIVQLSHPYRTTWKTIALTRQTFVGASLVAQLVNNPSTMWETWVWSLGWEDPLEKGKATHSSILAWRIPWTFQYSIFIFYGIK